jgi:hypothetical protein
MLSSKCSNGYNLVDVDAYCGLPVQQSKGPFVESYLSNLKAVIDAVFAEFPRVFAFRVDLRLPVDFAFREDASRGAISLFLESFKAKIKHDRDMAKKNRNNVHDTSVRYVWAREYSADGRPHHHVMFFLNRDAYFSLGKLQSNNVNMIHRLEEAWASALGLTLEQVSGLVHVPENPSYLVSKGEWEGRCDIFYRASYLCKLATKRYGDGRHGFGYSRG